MRLSSDYKIRKVLQEMIDVELSSVLRSKSRVGELGLTQTSIHEMSKCLVDRMIGNARFLEAIGEIAAKQEKEWLTTEEAARLSGFSRPFIAALLDGSGYAGRVIRSEKGHRRVHAADFRQWLAKLVASERLLTVADVRTGIRLEPECEGETAEEKDVRVAARRRALQRARILGIA